jgi:hypothetical protein
MTSVNKDYRMKVWTFVRIVGCFLTGRKAFSADYISPAPFLIVSKERLGNRKLRFL